MLIAFGVIYWAVYQLVSLALLLVGVPVVAALCATRYWKERANTSAWFPGTNTHWGSLVFWLWDNEENGVLGDAGFIAEHQKLPVPVRAFWWSALRNPVNNMRFLPLATFALDRSKLVVTEHADGWFARCGWRWALVYKKWRIGWRINKDGPDGQLGWPVLEPYR